MKIFGVNEAKYFCDGFTKELGPSNGSIINFFNNRLHRRTSIKEGNIIFDEYRACLLRESERNLFLAASHYRRCLDSMVPSATSWAYVTAYYGSWYAAHALLGMFGCKIFDKYVIDVKQSSLGNQELCIKHIGNGPNDESTTYRGTHRIFWDLFYKSINPLRPIVPNHLVTALTPISGEVVWQIRNRNSINYDSFEALRIGQIFQSSFSEVKFPSSLPGTLCTQYGVFDAMIQLAFYFAKQFLLQTDALLGFGLNKKRSSIIKTLIFNNKRNNLAKLINTDPLLR